MLNIQTFIFNRNTSSFENLHHFTYLHNVALEFNKEYLHDFKIKKTALARFSPEYLCCFNMDLL